MDSLLIKYEDLSSGPSIHIKRHLKLMVRQLPKTVLTQLIERGEIELVPNESLTSPLLTNVHATGRSPEEKGKHH